MAGQRRTRISGVFITALLALMLLPGEYTVATHTVRHNQGHHVKCWQYIVSTDLAFRVKSNFLTCAVTGYRINNPRSFTYFSSITL